MPVPKPQRDALNDLAAFAWTKPFRLVGGTALALQYGHRLSEDLDFFTPEPFDAARIMRALETTGSFALKRRSDFAVTGTWNKALVTFLHYQYPWLARPVMTAQTPMPLSHPLDIGLMKIEAISQRGARRDFVDLFFICRREKALEELLGLYPRKFGESATPVYHLLRSLAYFDDAEKQPDVATKPRVDWKKVRGYFEGEVARLAAKELGA